MAYRVEKFVMTAVQRQLILVLDQEPEVREDLCEQLALEGNRGMALASLPEEPYEVAELQPTRVMLDHFPGTPSSGTQFLRQLPIHPATHSIPIPIGDAAKAGRQAREDDLEARDIAVILKPFDRDDLLDAVRGALNAGRVGRAVASFPGVPHISLVKMCHEGDASWDGDPWRRVDSDRDYDLIPAHQVG